MRTRESLHRAAAGCLVLALALGLARPGLAELIPGGGKAAADCYGELDVRGADGSKRVTCVDGDPACDVDGECQGICTFDIAVCLNQTNLPGCTPQPLRRPATVGGGLPVPTAQGADAVCGPHATFEVPLKGRQRSKPRTSKVRLVVVTTGKPGRDTDTILLRCQPRREGACPTTTSTTASAATTSTTASAATTSTEPVGATAPTSTSTTTTSTTVPTVPTCDDDTDCRAGVCSQGVCCNRACATPCNVCSAATGGICTPVSCGMPGECETGPGTCNLQTGACDYPVAADGTSCGGEVGGRRCCNGGCCEEGADCVGGTCQVACSVLGTTCQDEEQCCQDGVTFCAGTCCHDLEESCATDAECCTGRCRNGEVCCAPPGARCTNEGDCCLAEMGACRLNPGTSDRTCRCLQPDEACRGSQECCGLDVCADGTCRAGTCLPPQSPCRTGFECCWDGSTTCAASSGTNLACCRGNGAVCSTAADCCDGPSCEGGRCCRPAGGSCNSNTLCCAGLMCREGACQPSCPLGSFPCGAACCGGHQFCVANTCQCVPLGGTCNPSNNLCCRSEETLCPAQNAFGNANTCCRPQGGHCSSAADCCDEIYDPTWGRDTCGDDGICGGNGAFCGVDADCVGGRSCIGLCTGPGQGFKLCSSSGQCPAGQLCSQRRCIHPDALPD